MKILCVADEKDPLVYSDGLKIRFKDIDMIFGCGDLSIDYYEFIVSMLNKPLLFVYGNHNFAGFSHFSRKHDHVMIDLLETLKFDKKSYGSTYIDGKVKSEKGIIIAGLGGSMRYNKGENQYTELGMFLRIVKIIPYLFFNRIFHKRYLDVLITHAPPRGIHDEKDLCHKGFKVFLWFMKIFKPKYLIHGHIHIYDRNIKRKTKYFDTTVINAYGHIVLDL